MLWSHMEYLAAASLNFVPYDLKHLHRGPINFSRLSDRLWPRIIQKQAAMTQLNLGEASKKSSEVVDDVLAQIPTLQNVKAAILLVGKDKLLRECDVVNVYCNLGTITFRQWAIKFTKHMRLGIVTETDCSLGKALFRTREQSLQKSEILLIFYAILNYSKQKSPEEKWQSERIYGPDWMDLKPVPRIVWQRIMIKCSLVSVSRLAVTSSTGNLAAVTCNRSTKLLEFQSKCCLVASKKADVYQQSIWMEARQFTEWPYRFSKVVKTVIPDENELQEFLKYSKDISGMYWKLRLEESVREEYISKILGYSDEDYFNWH